MLNEQGKELVMIRTTGGPKPGDRIVTLDQIGGGDWPPPETIPFGKGVYERIRMSSFPDDVGKHPNITRGAEYLWKDLTHLWN